MASISFRETVELLNRITITKSNPTLMHSFGIKKCYTSGCEHRILTKCSILFAFSEKRLRIYISGILLLDETTITADKIKKARTKKETELIVKQLDIFQNLYDDYLDEQLEKLDAEPEEESSVSLKPNVAIMNEASGCDDYATIVKKDCDKQINDHDTKSVILMVVSCAFFAVFGAITSVGFAEILATTAISIVFFMCNHYLYRKEKLLSCEKQIKAFSNVAPKKEIKQINESKALDKKNDELDDIMERLDKM